MSKRLVPLLCALASNAGLLGWLLPSACCLLVGCSSGPQMERDLYTRELRLQEDEIYRLEDCLEECHGIIRAMRQENNALKQQIGQPAGKPSAPPRAEKIEDAGDSDGERSLLDDFDWRPDRPDPTEQPETREAPAPPDNPTPPPAAADIPDIELPTIDGGDPTEAPPFTPPASSAPEPIAPPAGEPLGLLGDDAAAGDASQADDAVVLASHESPARVDSKADGSKIDAIAMRAGLGRVLDSGEQTLVAHVRPLHVGKLSASFEGPASLLLRAPEREGDQAVLARWDYTAEEVAEAWEATGADRRLAFTLLLDGPLLGGETPADEPLELWVRLTDTSGRRLLAPAPVNLTPPPSERTPREPAPAATASIDETSAQAGGWASQASAEVASPPPSADQWKRARGAPLGSEIRVASFEEVVTETETSSPAQPAKQGWSSRKPKD